MNAPKLNYAPEPMTFPGIDIVGSDSFEQDVLLGLAASPKSIPCKYLYDARGSALFDQICELPEYYPTRSELELTRASAASIAAQIGPDAVIVEPGAGSTTKIRILLDALETPELYLPLDISGAHLRQSAEALRDDYPSTLVLPVEADFTSAFELRLPMGSEGPRVIYFPGSTIGNFERAEARALLASFAAPLRPQDYVLVGWDRLKSADTLVPAYDDSQGVTAAFITNLLVRMQDELGAQLDPSAFELDTQWQAEHERIRISLRPRSAQKISLSGREFSLEANEELFVEHSHKYSDATMHEIAAGAGLENVRTWTDEKRWFALSLFRPKA